MPKEEMKDLLRFLAPFPDEVKDMALWLREFVWDLYPTANELIYDNYNALAFGWSVTEKVGHTFCNIAVGRTTHNVHFGFYWGAEIADPERLLIGNGVQYRYLLVKSKDSFPTGYIKKLLSDAYINSFSKVKDPKQLTEGKTILKSVSEVKRVSK